MALRTMYFLQPLLLLVMVVDHDRPELNFQAMQMI